MKALSLKPEWAMPVMLGMKTVECRTWQTSYRGDLLICSSAKPLPCTIAGHALCVVELTGIEPFRAEHIAPAMLDGLDVPAGSYAWMLENLRWIEPFEVKGKLNLYDVADDLIKYLPDDMGDRDCLTRYYEPLMTWSSRDVSEGEARDHWNGILGSF